MQEEIGGNLLSQPENRLLLSVSSCNDGSKNRDMGIGPSKLLLLKSRVSSGQEETFDISSSGLENWLL
jgi:hypothetical protein